MSEEQNTLKNRGTADTGNNHYSRKANIRNTPPTQAWDLDFMGKVGTMAHWMAEMLTEAARPSKRVLCGTQGKPSIGICHVGSVCGKPSSMILGCCPGEVSEKLPLGWSLFLGSTGLAAFSCTAAQEDAWSHLQLELCWWLFTKKPPKRQLVEGAHGNCPVLLQVLLQKPQCCWSLSMDTHLNQEEKPPPAVCHQHLLLTVLSTMRAAKEKHLQGLVDGIEISGRAPTDSSGEALASHLSEGDFPWSCGL